MRLWTKRQKKGRELPKPLKRRTKPRSQNQEKKFRCSCLLQEPDPEEPPEPNDENFDQLFNTHGEKYPFLGLLYVKIIIYYFFIYYS